MNTNTDTMKKQCESIVQAGSQVTMHNANGELCFINIKDFPHTAEPIGERKDDKYDITFYGVPEGITVPAYDESTHSVVLAKPTGWSEHRGLDIEIVKLSSGKQIITDDDPRAVYGVAKDDPNMELRRFTPSEALAHKVLVPAVYESGLKRYDVDEDGEIVEHDPGFDEEDVNAGKFVWDDDGPQAEFDFVTGRVIVSDEDRLDANESAKALGAHPIIVPMDFEFGQFLGCLAGDGWWDHTDYAWTPDRNAKFSRRIYLADNEGDNAKFVTSYIKKRIAPDASVVKQERLKEQDPGRYGDTTKYTYYDDNMTFVTRTLDVLLGGERDENTAGSGNKHLPLWMAAASDAVKLGILAGLLSTDGTISISKHKGEKRSAQLLVSITSTSLTLLEDVQGMLRTTGITSTIGFSKVTTANNVSWILTVCTTDLKAKEDLMRGMCNKRKLDVLLKATVTTANGNYTGARRVLFPDVVADRILSWIPQPCKQSAKKKGDEAAVAYASRCFNVADAVRKGKEKGVVTEDAALRIIKFLHEHRWSHTSPAILKDVCLALVSSVERPCGKEDYAGVKLQLSESELEHLDYGVSLLASMQLRRHSQTAKALFDAAYKINRLIDRKVRRVPVERLLTLAAIAQEAQEKLTYEYITFSDQIYGEWEDMALGGFTWSVVEDVIKTGIKATGYDLTVPGYETFMGADGTIRSNTINVHVPSTDAAVKEVKERLMPSQNPFIDRQPGMIYHTPKQEEIIGLYAAATAPATEPIKFNSRDEALQAIRQGKIKLSDDIDYPGMDQDVGFVRQ